MDNAVKLAAVVEAVPKWRRSFWKNWTEERKWSSATDGGFWWSSPVLIERMPMAPKHGVESPAIITFLDSLRGRETVFIPDECLLNPPKHADEAAQCNFGKVGHDTLLMNADYVAHIVSKGYAMRRVVGDGVEPVLLYKGDRLMGLVMPQISPEYVERWKTERGWRR